MLLFSVITYELYTIAKLNLPCKLILKKTTNATLTHNFGKYKVKQEYLIFSIAFPNIIAHSSNIKTTIYY